MEKWNGVEKMYSSFIGYGVFECNGSIDLWGDNKLIVGCGLGLLSFWIWW